MLLPILAILSLTGPAGADTSFAVQRGDRLEVAVHTGDVTVRAWDRNTVQVRTSDDGRVSVNRHGGVIRLGAETRRHGSADGVDYEISAPAWMALSLTGVNSDIRVTGSNADVTAQTVEGDVEVRGGNGVISLQSVDGSVKLSDARGKIDVSSVNSDVVVDGATGAIAAQSVNGEIRLRNVDSDDADANTVNGDVVYDGPIHPRGRYHIVTHNGDITMAIGETADATVSVATYQGDFEATFPVSVTGTVAKRFAFTLGSGSARIELESFQGTIRLERAGAAGKTRKGR